MFILAIIVLSKKNGAGIKEFNVATYLFTRFVYFYHV